MPIVMRREGAGATLVVASHRALRYRLQTNRVCELCAEGDSGRGKEAYCLQLEHESAVRWDGVHQPGAKRTKAQPALRPGFRRNLGFAGRRRIDIDWIRRVYLRHPSGDYDIEA